MHKYLNRGDEVIPSQMCFKVLGRGLASTVRKCVEKGTGLMFAVKIVDISTERQSEHEAARLLNETISEVNLLRQLAGHPSISKFFQRWSRMQSHSLAVRLCFVIRFHLHRSHWMWLWPLLALDSILIAGALYASPQCFLYKPGKPAYRSSTDFSQVGETTRRLYFCDLLQLFVFIYSCDQKFLSSIHVFVLCSFISYLDPILWKVARYCNVISYWWFFLAESL